MSAHAADRPRALGADRSAAWSRQTAGTWEEGVVAGTGSVGAIVYGSPSRHSVVFTHERFFAPVHSRRPAPHLAPALPSVREALEVGDGKLAADLVEARLEQLGIDPNELVWTDPLAPIGALHWDATGHSWDDYRREVPLGHGGLDISWRVDGKERAGLRLTAEHGHDELQLALWSDVPLSGRLKLGEVDRGNAHAGNAPAVAAGTGATHVVNGSGTLLESVVTVRGFEPGTDASAWIRVESETPMVLDGQGEWLVELLPGRSELLLIRVGTSSAGSPAGPGLDAGEVLARSELDLDTGGRRESSVEDWWARARDGDPIAERVVIETAYAAGRRNVLASTGMLPPTLQGVWQGTWAPAWSCDYTLNGNVQLGALASVLWTGMPELMTSLFRLVTPFAADYRHNAEAIYGLKGMLLPPRMTTHGHLNHFLREYPHQFWVGNGAWLLRMAADYISVTGDRSPLHSWLWQFTTEILEFNSGVLAAGGGSITPSYSPENTPSRADNPLVCDATVDVAAIRDAFAVGAWFAELVGNHQAAARWTSELAATRGYQIAADGTLAEWSTRWPENLAHRHSSQLYGLWYVADKAFDNPDLRRAAQETVLRKVAWRAANPAGPPGNMEMAFGLSSIGIAAAALGDAPSAYQCALWLARDHFTAGLVSTHDAGTIFNIDASGALPAVLAAMLVGSSPGVVRLLPALPTQWPSGRVSGLCARSGVHIDELAWEPERIDVSLSLPPESSWLRPHGVTIRLPWDCSVEPNRGAEQLDSYQVQVRSSTTAIRLVFRRQ